MSVVLALTALLLGGCSGGGDSPGSGPRQASAAAEGQPAGSHAVGVVSRAFVDRSRVTPANGDEPERSARTLPTKVYYPATGGRGGDAGDNAPADRAGGPYPLVIFAHGLAEQQSFLAPLIERWVAAGYVVASPTFPLTQPYAPGGVNAADVQRQPGDVSFVIDQVLTEARRSSGPLSGLIDPARIAITGHSNGAITTLGAVANTCCRESRATAAIVMAGMDPPYAAGRYDFAAGPPTLLVHGVKDALIDYSNAVRVFNALPAPKGLLTLDESDHGDWLFPATPAFSVVAEATTDFLDAYLKDDRAALAKLPKDADAGVATMHFAAGPGGPLRLALSNDDRKRRVSASPTAQLTDGAAVTVAWSGFTPHKSINIVQCTGDGTGGVTTCDVLHGIILKLDPTGSGSATLHVRVGRIGSGRCDAQHACTIIVNDAASQEPGATTFVPITFAS